MSLLPPDIQSKIEATLNTQITSAHTLHGGDINQAARIETYQGVSYFLKWNVSTPDDMFEAEAKGLKLLSSAGTDLIIPKPLLIDKNFLLLEFVTEGGQGNHYQFGQELAMLHKTKNTQFGLDHSNYIGRLPQSNLLKDKWVDFFAEERIRPQVKMAIDSGKMNSDLARLSFSRPAIEFPEEPPALLHGDLWSGNFMFSASGKASIYDPAVYFGHREMDIAMTQLFGGFGEDFYRGYNDIYPLLHGAEERFKLCNLYPVLVHANLFGGHYVNRAKSILNQFFN